MTLDVVVIKYEIQGLQDGIFNKVVSSSEFVSYVGKGEKIDSEQKIQFVWSSFQNLFSAFFWQRFCY